MRILSGIVALILTLASPAHAQMIAEPIQETLPIEIKMLYMKLLKQQPDYDALVTANLSTETTAQQLQQQHSLKTIYDHAGTRTPLFVKQKLVITHVDMATQIITFKEPSASDPILFTLGAGESYGVFIRNADILKSLAPPFKFINIEQANAMALSSSPELPVEYVLMPLVADPTDFTLADGKTVHVILADVIDFKAFLPDRSRVILHKNFLDIPAPENASPSSGLMPSLSEAGIVIQP
jgi:hypothetical protein